MTPGLNAISDAYLRATGEYIEPEQIVYFIRYLNIGHGCTNQCSHCFADSPTKLEQMTLKSFTQITKEIGTALSAQMRPFSFFYFGASSDPSMIQDFASYLAVWFNHLPSWQKVKLYSHGWDLHSTQQAKEFAQLMGVIKALPDRLETFGLSVDLFSKKARNDFFSYISNVARNLSVISREVCLSKLKIQVTYPVERYYLDGSPTTLDYWKKLYRKSGCLPDVESMLEQIYQSATKNSQNTAKLTGAVINAGMLAGLKTEELIMIARDNKIPFRSGRGKKLYTGNNKKEMGDYAAKEQQNHALRTLNDNEFNYKGVVIYPSGRIRFLDCRLYELGSWLNNGDPILPYAEVLAYKKISLL